MNQLSNQEPLSLFFLSKLLDFCLLLVLGSHPKKLAYTSLSALKNTPGGAQGTIWDIGT